MTYFTSLSKESVKGLGSAAYLVSALPSAIMVVSVVALVEARLFPWQDPRIADGRAIEPGLPSVVDAAAALGVGGSVAFGAVVLVLTVVASPFQIAVVQLLEGYWSGRTTSFLTALAIEHHRRRQSVAIWLEDRSTHRLTPVGHPDFGRYARHARDAAQGKRIRARAQRRLADYPRIPDHIMPTRLGNVLRRAESTAGERYGLSTVSSYPRLYPHLSERLNTQLGYQLNGLDSSAALVVVTSILGIVSSPLLLRVDPWSIVPVALLSAAFVAYRGAIRAAGLYSQLLCTAYDLHRFTMLEAMHRSLPHDPDQEHKFNRELSAFVRDDPRDRDLPKLRRAYAHPAPPPCPGHGAPPAPPGNTAASDS